MSEGGITLTRSVERGSVTSLITRVFNEVNFTIVSPIRKTKLVLSTYIFSQVDQHNNKRGRMEKISRWSKEESERIVCLALLQTCGGMEDLLN